MTQIKANRFTIFLPLEEEKKKKPQTKFKAGNKFFVQKNFNGTITETIGSTDELSSLKESELSDLVKYLDEAQDAFERESLGKQ